MWQPHLRPSSDSHRREPFDAWYARVSPAIPQIPRELAEHWLYENWGVINYDYLDLSGLSATRGTLTLREALAVTVSDGWGAIEPGTALLDDFVEQEEWLALHMSRVGTWPVPIVVLDNEDGTAAPDRPEIGRRQLLEGHRRLTFLHGLEAAGTAAPTHEVWLVRSAERR